MLARRPRRWQVTNGWKALPPARRVARRPRSEIIFQISPRRPHITQPEALRALAHPLRLDLLTHLMASGPATASDCARAVGDSPSNCSYHLRVLARAGLVAETASDDGRERPWRALVTGFDTQSPEVLALSHERDERMIRDYIAGRDSLPAHWRDAEALSTYALRMTAAELRELGAQLDALIRPYIAPTRDDPPPGAALVHLDLHAFATELP